MTNAVDKYNAVQLLIDKKMMLVDTKNYVAAMLDNLWNMYPDDKKNDFCNNIIFYCDIANGYKGTEVKENPTLTISLKYENNDVIPLCEYANGILKYLPK